MFLGSIARPTPELWMAAFRPQVGDVTRLRLSSVARLSSEEVFQPLDGVLGFFDTQQRPVAR